MSLTADEGFMDRAIELAARGATRVYPNPRVGAVIVRDGAIIAEGWHAEFGGPHAERAALAELQTKGLDAEGATLYINLEPCAHQGHTPPCAEAVIAAGFARVVVAQRDPNPKVDGLGLRAIEKAGIELCIGPREPEARRLNAAFNKFMLTNRPLVTAKWAMSLDGKIAAHTGDSKWITSDQARRRAHQLRGEVDAIAVGLRTVLADNPRLNRRDVPGKDPVRIVVDSLARIPTDCTLVTTAKELPTFLVATLLAPEERIKALRRLGVGIIQVPAECQHVDPNAMLDELGRRGWQHLLIEGGGTLLGSFFSHDLVDQIAAFVAPKIIGGRDAPTPAGGQGVASVADALALDCVELEQHGPDILIRALAHHW